MRSIPGILPRADPVLAMDYAELNALYRNVLLCDKQLISFPTNSKISTTVISLAPYETTEAYAYVNVKTGYLNLPSICLGIKQAQHKGAV